MSAMVPLITGITNCLFNRLFRRRQKKPSKFRVTGHCEGKTPLTGEFPAQRTSNAEKCFHLMTSSWDGPRSVCTSCVFTIMLRRGMGYLFSCWSHICTAHTFSHCSVSGMSAQILGHQQEHFFPRSKAYFQDNFCHYQWFRWSFLWSEYIINSMLSSDATWQH